MSHNKNHDSQQLPVGRLGIISPYSCAELGTKVDNYLVSWRKKRHNEGVLYEGYDRDTYLIGSDLPRFGSGEAKGILRESVRGDDIYILVDVCNYSLTYSLAGQTNHMSPIVRSALKEVSYTSSNPIRCRALTILPITLFPLVRP